MEITNDIPILSIRSRALPRSEAAMILLFATTSFVGAALVFFLELMAAKMLLPYFGGAPSVWNTSLVFFQLLLLAGYSYAHFATKYLGIRRQAFVHGALLLVPMLFIPIVVPSNAAPSESASPILWLLWILLLAVGIPFCVVSTASPVLQRWFSSIDLRTSGDPYFLYAASNAGSLVALVGYPVLVEPYLGLTDQARIWAMAYLGFAVLCGLCLVALLRTTAGAVGNARAVERPTFTSTRKLDITTRCRWIAMAFIPSSLMVGVTNYLSTDVASAPMLWTLPLGIYLLTFIVAFSRAGSGVVRKMTAVLPIAAVFGVVASPVLVPLPIVVLVLMHLATLFVVGLVAHCRLASERPAAHHLTEFYLLLSVGGVLGGAFNALVAPVLFDAVVEYPIVLVISLLLVPVPSGHNAMEGGWVARISSFAFTTRLLLTSVVLSMAVIGVSDGALRWVLMGALVCVATLIVIIRGATLFKQRVSMRPLFYIVATIAVTLSPLFFSQSIVYSERTFFGVMQVREEAGTRHVLKHGTTIHGAQDFASPETRLEPLGYYTRTGPVGQLFNDLQRGRQYDAVGVIGLGTGAIAAYGQPGQAMTFFEIDPAVTRIASDPRYFSYLDDSAASIQVINGDGRLEIEELPDGTFDLVIVDAFSSDSIPTHLMTREAFESYARKVTDDGIIAIHISNRNLDLEPVIGALARDLDLVSLTRVDTITDVEAQAGKFASQWCVLARSEDVLDLLLADDRWRSLASDTSVWTDDFSNIISTLRWLQ